MKWLGLTYLDRIMPPRIVSDKMEGSDRSQDAGVKQVTVGVKICHEYEGYGG